MTESDFASVVAHYPPDVRRQGGIPGVRPVSWLQRDRGDGKPVWRSPGTTPEGTRFRPGEGGTSSPRLGDPGHTRTWRGFSPRGGSEPAFLVAGAGSLVVGAYGLLARSRTRA